MRPDKNYQEVYHFSSNGNISRIKITRLIHLVHLYDQMKIHPISRPKELFLILIFLGLSANVFSALSSAGMGNAETTILSNKGLSNLALYSAPGEVDGKVWKDLDGDGLQDFNEPGIGGVIVRLYDCSDNLIDTKPTLGNGSFLFTNVAIGSYKLSFDISSQPETCDFTFKGLGGDGNVDSDANKQGVTNCFNVGDGETVTDIDAGLLILATIMDKVWHDLDGDGIQDDGEAGIPNVTVNIYTQSGKFSGSDVTDIAGEYQLDNLYPGDYYLKFFAPEGYKNSPSNQGFNENKDSDVDGSNGPGTTQLTSLGPGEVDDSWDAGFFLCVPIGDLVWYDTDKDDVWDDVENGINGLRVDLWKNINGVWTMVDWQYTGHKPGTPSDDGYFKFCADPGTYYLEFELPPFGLVLADYDVGFDEERDSDVGYFNGPNTTRTFSVRSGDKKCDFGAGFYPMATIGDQIWLDYNVDGIRDSGEALMGGVKVQAYDIYNDLIGETVADENGKYEIDYLQKNSYYLRFIPPKGYSVTTPNMGNDDSMDSDVDHSNGLNTTAFYQMVPGEHIINVDAGLVYSSLPVELVSFQGRQRDDHVYIQWETASEINSDHFALERKKDLEEQFNAIGRLQAEGLQNTGSEYSFDDYELNVSGVYYYRLKSVDLDGRFVYSDIISVEFKQTNKRTSEIDIFPNPAKGATTLELRLDGKAFVKGGLYSMTGILVKANIINDVYEGGIHQEEINIRDIPAGIYTIKMDIGDDQVTKRIIVLDN